jgi:hypothetical protein
LRIKKACFLFFNVENGFCFVNKKQLTITNYNYFLSSMVSQLLMSIEEVIQESQEFAMHCFKKKKINSTFCGNHSHQPCDGRNQWTT